MVSRVVSFAENKFVEVLMLRRFTLLKIFWFDTSFAHKNQINFLDVTSGRYAFERRPSC